jgi:hypothetical protein
VDLATDPATGDFMFGGTRDLMGCTGPELVNQRILTRARIPRGTFAYDENGTLGSRLHSIMGYPSQRQISSAPALVQEAVEPMDDIRVTNVTVNVTDDNRLELHVKWVPVVGRDETVPAPTEITPDFDAK